MGGRLGLSKTSGAEACDADVPVFIHIGLRLWFLLFIYTGFFSQGREGSVTFSLNTCEKDFPFITCCAFMKVQS